MSNNKQSMKLYTEEQVDKIALQVINYGYWDNREVTPIVIPSDEEIQKEADKEESNSKHYAFTRGAMYVIDKIQGGQL